MSVLMLKTPSVIQTLGPVEIDPRWLSRGLQMVIDNGVVVFNRESRAFTTRVMTGGPKSQVSRYGRAAGFGTTWGTGTTDRINTGAKLYSPVSGKRSVVARLFAKSTGGGGFGRVYQNTTGNGIANAGDEALYFNSGGLAFNRVCSSLSGAQYTTASSITLDKWVTYGCSFLGDYPTNTVPLMFLDGLAVSVNTNQAPTAAFTASTSMEVALGNRGSDSLRIWDGLIDLILLFDGFLEPKEHVTLAANPRQVFLRNRAIWVGAEGGAYTAIISEALTLADSASQVASLSASNSEALVLSESVSLIAGFAASTTESLPLSETQDVVLGFVVSNTEGVSLADSESLQTGFAVTVSEGMTLEETITLTTGFASSISEALVLSETSSNVANFLATLGESLTLDSAASATLTGDYSASITESMILGSESSNVAALSASISEALVLADSVSNVAALSATISEAMALSDSLNGVVVGDFTVIATELMSLADASSVQAALGASLSEAMSLADTNLLVWGQLASLSEAMSLADVASMVLNSVDELYPLSGLTETWPLVSVSESWPLAGLDELYPLEGLI